MLVTALVGSPNKGGPTRVAVDAVLRGAEKEAARQPSLNGSRGAPVSTTQKDINTVYTVSASVPV